jgi:hypothetical protein
MRATLHRMTAGRATVSLARPAALITLAAVTVILAACGSSGSSANTPTLPTGGTQRATPATYADAFAYCSAAGTVDAPDARYTGPQYPQAVLDALTAAVGHPIVTGVAPWRCMDGAVWGCDVGANLPCGKINTSKTPTQAMNGYCASNPGSMFIPAYVSGHDTAYAWSCEGTQAVAGRQVITVDARGFAKQYWYRLAPPGG